MPSPFLLIGPTHFEDHILYTIANCNNIKNAMATATTGGGGQSEPIQFDQDNNVDDNDNPAPKLAQHYHENIMQYPSAIGWPFRGYYGFCAHISLLPTPPPTTIQEWSGWWLANQMQFDHKVKISQIYKRFFRRKTRSQLQCSFENTS